MFISEVIFFMFPSFSRPTLLIYRIYYSHLVPSEEPEVTQVAIQEVQFRTVVFRDLDFSGDSISRVESFFYHVSLEVDDREIRHP